MTYTLHHGDCLDVLKTLPDCSVDSIVTDPPAGIAFMNKSWDSAKGGRDNWVAWMAEIASECLRVLKPGGHALVWAIPRTSHWTATAWENAGFEVRDRVSHVFGSGFPKSLDVSKAIDRAAGAERSRELKFTGTIKGGALHGGKEGGNSRTWNKIQSNEPATDDARQWQGWGTALKPAMEDWWLLRKPLIGTVAENVLRHGTGGINVDGCRVGDEGGTTKGNPPKDESNGIYGHGINGACNILDIGKGRFPANFTHDGSEEVTDLLGEAARFFYCAKASKRDRDEGLKSDVAFSRQGNRPGSPDETGKFPDHDHRERTGNFHPTVKPTDLMRYLCRLVTPPGGIVLDPFTGSGSTGKAAILEGFQFVGIEREADYIEIARARIEHAQKEKSGMLL